MRFEEQPGIGANGAPFYKSTTGEQYIYYDMDCSGAGTCSPKWIIDNTAPNISRAYDLDGDGSCDYHASLDWENSSLPEGIELWSMFCGDGWSQRMLSFGTNESAAGPYDAEEEDQEGVELFAVSGACEEKAYLNGLVFQRMGETLSGAPFYRSVTLDQYIYHDAACGTGAGAAPARWILDADAPNVSRAEDLDDDGVCDYHARTRSGDSARPPARGMWRMYCGRQWRDLELVFREVASTSSPGRLMISPAAGRALPLLGLCMLFFRCILS